MDDRFTSGILPLYHRSGNVVDRGPPAAGAVGAIQYRREALMKTGGQRTILVLTTTAVASISVITAGCSPSEAPQGSPASSASVKAIAFPSQEAVTPAERDTPLTILQAHAHDYYLALQKNDFMRAYSFLSTQCKSALSSSEFEQVVKPIDRSKFDKLAFYTAYATYNVDSNPVSRDRKATVQAYEKGSTAEKDTPTGDPTSWIITDPVGYVWKLDTCPK